jgi:hypothetical protein
MIPIHQRKKRVPSVAGFPVYVRDISDEYQKRTFEELDKQLPKTDLLPHQLRKRELAELHGISEKDVFVDPKNGVELYRSTNGWVHDPKYRGID